MVLPGVLQTPPWGPLPLTAHRGHPTQGWVICVTMRLRTFQTRFLRGALAPDVDTAALSIPRGNGKSWLAGHVLTRCMTPGDRLHVAGAEFLLCAASIEQARVVFRFVRPELEAAGGYRFLDSATRIGITHKASNTRLRSCRRTARRPWGSWAARCW